MPPKKEKVEQPICSICCNIFNKSKNKAVNCDFCNSEACLECIKHYILDTHGDFHCMFCRNKWNRDVLVQKLPQVFIKDELREHHENKIVEIEKARLPAAQTVAENRIKMKNIEMIRDIANRLTREQVGEKNEAQLELIKLIAKNYGIDDDISQLSSVIEYLESEAKTEVKRNYVRNCPNNECRGFINDKWNCGLCQTKMCKKCFEQIDDENKHKCDQNIIESNRLIEKDSKPCPKCNCLITKLSGCFSKDQPIILWDGTIKMSQDIEIGDELIGDDGEKRVVEMLTRGDDDMYEVHQDGGDTYIVNSKHKLVLKNVSETIEILVEDFINLSESVRSTLFGFKIDYTTNYCQKTKLDIIKVGKGRYYGWIVDKNKRFLLPDHTVVHNCDQMFCVQCHTAFSWTKGTIEKGIIHNPHYYQWQKTLQQNAPQVQQQVNICDENYFPTYSTLASVKTSDYYLVNNLARFHQFITHIYSVVRPDYLRTVTEDLKMEIDVNYMMTAFGKTEWKRQLYAADRKQEMSRDVLELIDMVYAISGERFRNFIKDGDKEHIKDVERVLVYMMDELEKIKKRHISKLVIIHEPCWLTELRPVKSI
jgi:hypothetical protein